MRPTFSIIFFTVVSGCGFGLLFLVGAIESAAPALFSRNAALVSLALGVAFASAGFAVPQKILNLSSAKNIPSTVHT